MIPNKLSPSLALPLPRMLGCSSVENIWSDSNVFMSTVRHPCSENEDIELIANFVESDRSVDLDSKRYEISAPAALIYQK